MRKVILIAAFIAVALSSIIPIKKNEMTKDMINGQLKGLTSKFTEGEEIDVEDFLNA